MYDALYADEAERVLDGYARRPDLLPKPKIGMFAGFGEALRAALPAAATETARVFSPLLDAYGKAAAFREGAAQEDSIERMGENDLSPLLGRELKRITPDPHTTGTASQIVFGAGKLLGKAAGYGAVGGPWGAAIGTGLDEGASEMLKLTDKGVDTATAIKAGAVHGAATAASIALPVAGKTLTQTLGLALAGGPASFIGENAAIQSILERADFAEVAREYDPFDPVGLSVSTIVPLVFGAAAHGMRGLPRNAAPDARPAADLPRLSPEEEAAARTLLLARQADEASLAPRQDIAARNAHADLMEAAARRLDDGQPVELPVHAAVDEARITEASARMSDAAELLARRASAELPQDAPAPLRRGAETDFDAEAATTNRVSTDGEMSTRAEPLDVQLARRIAEESPDRIVYGDELNAQGNPVAKRAADLWAEIETDIEVAKREARMFAAAVECHLRNPD